MATTRVEGIVSIFVVRPPSLSRAAIYESEVFPKPAKPICINAVEGLAIVCAFSGGGLTNRCRHSRRHADACKNCAHHCFSGLE